MRTGIRGIIESGGATHGGQDAPIIDAGSYPKRIKGVYKTGGGPHLGSGLTLDTAVEILGSTR